METRRTRSSGWKHAKLSGHENEYDVKKLFDNEEYRVQFSKRLGIGEIQSVSVGGLCEKNVASVFGDTTKSKSDLIITLKEGNFINISIKKSNKGQVYLIGVDRFIDGFERQYEKDIPDVIKELMHIYFFGSEQTEKLLNNNDVTAGELPELIEYQRNHNRLVWKSLHNWNENKAIMLLDWFKDNINNIADFCFSKGLAKNEDNWAQYVWYINLLGETSLDAIYSIEDIKNACNDKKELVTPSRKYGGSTILLPFGFVQWHQQKMQFHHKYDAIRTLF